MGKNSSPPPAPDYTAAANATAQGNLSNAIFSQYGNMVNQSTPYGSVNYSQDAPTAYINAAGRRITPEAYAQKKASGQDVAGWNPLQTWTQKVTLSPEQQAAYNKDVQMNSKLQDVGLQGVGYVQSALDKPLSFSGMQDLGTPGEIQQAASDAAYANATRYLDPQFGRQQNSLENQLANQGITRGSEAWNNAMDEFNANKNNAYSQAQNQAYIQGLSGANQAYNQSLGLRQQQIGEAQTLRQDPINMLNAVRTGSQLQSSQMPQVAASAPGQLATVSGPDLLSATTAQGQYNMGTYNANQASSNNLSAGVFGLGSAGIGAMGMMAMSDPRVKENVVKIGCLNNGLNLYRYEYKPEWKDEAGHGSFVGVMADEAEKIVPDAVITRPDGYKMVDYGVIYG